MFAVTAQVRSGPVWTQSGGPTGCYNYTRLRRSHQWTSSRATNGEIGPLGSTLLPQPPGNLGFVQQ